MRVLMTADAVGGIWTYALDLGRALRQRDVTVALAVLGPDPDAAQRKTAAEAGLDVVALGHPPEWLASDAAAVARAGTALAALARRWGATVIHLNHAALAASAAFPAPLLVMGHSCLATWWDAVACSPLPESLAWQADLVGQGYRRATVVAAPTAAFADATRARYGLAHAPHVVPNGRLAPPPTVAGPVPSGLTAGRLWDGGKDAATLDRAAALATVPIRAAGPTVGPEGSRATFAHLQTLGALPAEAVRDLMAQRPVYLSAARYEPFGLSVLEAAQAGCALVLSDIPTFRELWDGAALLVPVGDADGFARALDGLVADGAARARLAQAAQARAATYTPDAQADRTLDLYAAMLRGASDAGIAAA